ncbi:MAG: hydrolase [Bdellovibrionales bacterium]|nr:hydrolase [Bdellovibrionales bacterium]
MKTRDEALALLHEYTKSDSLIKHALSVEAGMRWYANHFGNSAEDVEVWGITGLLHDFDYEMFPNPVAPDGHPYKGNQILEELGYPEDIRTAIMGHALYTNTPRDSQMAKTLFAVDELSGLITAAVLVRPDKSIHELQVKSVKKKFKDKAFARGCNRDEMKQGAEELEVPMDDHIQNVISAMQAVADELGLAG